MLFTKDNNSSNKCYAQCLGNCSTKISGEHVYTSSIFGGSEPIGFEGNAKIPNSFIGRKSATANILCVKHNSELSVLDSEAKRLGDAIRHIHTEDGKFEVIINGFLLERWLLKVTIGHLVAGYTNLGKIYPIAPLVQALYGHISIDPPLGLHTITPVDRTSDRTEELLFRELTAKHDDHGVCVFGSFIALHGMPFLLELGGPFPVQGYLVKPDGLSYLDPYDTTRATAKYRPPTVAMSNIDYSRELVVKFQW